MKQQVFKKPNYYGNMKKAILSTYEKCGKKIYYVGFFKSPDDLSANEGAEFGKRKDAMYSIDCFLSL